MEEDSSWSAFAYAAVAVAGLVLYLVYRYVYVSLARYTDIMNWYVNSGKFASDLCGLISQSKKQLGFAQNVLVTKPWY